MTDIGTVARNLRRQTIGLPAGPGGFGFDSLSDESCAALLTTYERGIEDIESGQSNYACGGNSLRQVRRWHKSLVAEIASRA